LSRRRYGDIQLRIANCELRIERQQLTANSEQRTAKAKTAGPRHLAAQLAGRVF
jgi:hypothetical protein